MRNDGKDARDEKSFSSTLHASLALLGLRLFGARESGVLEKCITAH